MKSIIQLLAFLLILLGIYTLVFPDSLFGFMEDNMERTSLYLTAIIVRIVLGILLIITAHNSIFPIAIKVIGYIALIAAIMLIILGHNGFQDLVATVIEHFKPFAKITGLIIIAFGGFLLYAFIAKKQPTFKIN